MAARPEAERLSSRVFPALNAGCLLVGISIFSVVPGLTPVRALPSLTSKVPNPTR